MELSLEIITEQVFFEQLIRCWHARWNSNSIKPGSAYGRSKSQHTVPESFGKVASVSFDFPSA